MKAGIYKLERIQKIIDQYKEITLKQIITNHKEMYDKQYEKNARWHKEYDQRVADANWDENKKSAFRRVMDTIRSSQDSFTEEDTSVLDLFTGAIDTLVKTNNMINNFKASKLDIVSLFNEMKKEKDYRVIRDHFEMPRKLRGHFVHLFSIVKNIQSPSEFIVAYKFERSINQLIFGKRSDDDYVDLLGTYQSFAEMNEKKDLTFYVYTAVILNLIVNDLNELHPPLTHKEYKQAKKFIFQLGDRSESLKLDCSLLSFQSTASISVIEEKLNNSPFVIGVIDTAAINLKTLTYIQEANLYICDTSKKEIEWVASIEQIYLSQEDVPSHTEIIELQMVPSKGEKIWLKINGFSKLPTRMMLDQFVPVHGTSANLPQQDVHLVFTSNTEKVKGKGKTMRNETMAGEILPNRNHEELTFNPNLILYGPPGTGKTYQLATKSLEIIYNMTADELEEKWM